jgi:hypothetical protein
LKCEFGNKSEVEFKAEVEIEGELWGDIGVEDTGSGELKTLVTLIFSFVVVAIGIRRLFAPSRSLLLSAPWV